MNIIIPNFNGVVGRERAALSVFYTLDVFLLRPTVKSKKLQRAFENLKTRILNKSIQHTEQIPKGTPMNLEQELGSTLR